MMELKLKIILQQKQKLNLYRRRNINFKHKFCCFSRNDYLGLANHPAVIHACKIGLDKYGVGSGASKLLGGYGFSHFALEEELAEFLGYEKVLLFSTGYMANLGILTSLYGGEGTQVFIDRLTHASIIDGTVYSGTKFARYRHNNMQNLKKLLNKVTAKYKLIISEGIFSMDGDLAPLKIVTNIAHQSDSWLMIDDAHAIGVLGVNGRGSIEHHKINPQDVQILVGTFGKAFGTFGAFVASSKTVIESLIQLARTYIYTTSIPGAIAEATRASLKLIQKESWRRDHLNFLIKKFKCGARQLGLPLLSSSSPIQPLIIGDANYAKRIAKQLWQRGVLVGLIRPPTVPNNTSRLRISLNANHSEKDIEYLLDALHQIVK